MTELILTTFSPSLKLNLKYMDIINHKTNDDLSEPSIETIDSVKPMTLVTNDLVPIKKTTEIKVENKINQNKFVQLNKTYPQYKKNNYENIVKCRLSRSFSFDLLVYSDTGI